MLELVFMSWQKYSNINSDLWPRRGRKRPNGQSHWGDEIQCIYWEIGLWDENGYLGGNWQKEMKDAVRSVDLLMGLWGGSHGMGTCCEVGVGVLGWKWRGRRAAMGMVGVEGMAAMTVEGRSECYRRVGQCWESLLEIWSWLSRVKLIFLLVWTQ